MSRSGDFHGDNGQTDRQTDYFTPAHARGVIRNHVEDGICLPTVAINSLSSKVSIRAKVDGIPNS